MIKLATACSPKALAALRDTSEAQILRGAQALCCVDNQQEARRVKGNIIVPRHMGRSKKGRSASGRRRASVISYECQKPATATVKIFRRQKWPRRCQISLAHVRSGDAGTSVHGVDRVGREVGTQQARCNALVLVPADMPVSHPQANRCRPWGGAVWARLEQRVRLCCSLQRRVAGRVQERLETIPARISAPSGFWCTGCLSGKQTLPEKLDPTFWIGHLWRGKQALGQGAKALRRHRTRV